MTLGGKIDDTIRIEFRKYMLDTDVIADISLYKSISAVVGHRCQRIQVACIGQFVDADDFMLALSDKVTDEGGADESSTPCDEQSHKSDFLQAFRTAHSHANAKRLVTSSKCGTSLDTYVEFHL